jgi:multiple sugar transport system substrate-binding protein
VQKDLKAFLFMLLSIVLLFGLAACGSANNNAPSETAANEPSANTASNAPAAEDKKEPVEIRFAWWGDTKRNELYNAIVDRFEEEYPHITVKREFGGWGDYWDRLTTQIAGGNAPDVVSMHQFYVSDYARRDALVDLDTVVSSGELNLADFPESAIDSGKINDTLYMVPKGVTMPGWAYNTALLDELGVEYPDMDWTWDDFIAKVIEIKEKSGSKNIWGAPDGGGGQPQPNFRYFLRQNGQDLYTEDGKLGFTKDKLVEWWTMWDGLRQKGAIPDATTGTEYENAPLEQNMFVKGLTAITQIPANQIYLYQQQFQSGEIRMVRMPRKEGGENGEYIEGAYLSITKKSKHPKEAALFINFFINSEKSLELFKVEQGSPASTKMSEFVKPLLDPAQQRAVSFIQETLQYAQPSVYAPLGAAEVEQAFKDNATAIAFGQKSVEEAAESFIKTAEEVLK